MRRLQGGETASPTTGPESIDEQTRLSIGANNNRPPEGSDTYKAVAVGAYAEKPGRQLTRDERIQQLQEEHDRKAAALRRRWRYVAQNYPSTNKSDNKFDILLPALTRAVMYMTATFTTASKIIRHNL